jgi:hypothetical protein
MTHSFHWSRLAEIDEAAPVDPVPFPTRTEVDVLKRTLKRLRETLVNPAGPASGSVPKTSPRSRTR